MSISCIRGSGLAALAAGLGLSLSWSAASLAQGWNEALDTLDGWTSLMAMALEAERYPDEALIAEFGPFVSPKEAAARASRCHETWSAAVSSIGVMGSAEYAADNARLAYVKALEISLKSRAAYRAELEAWSGMTGNDAEAFFDKQVKAKRDSWRKAEEQARAAAGQFEAWRAEAARLRKETSALFARLLEVPVSSSPDKAAEVYALQTKAIERCRRLHIWEERGAIKAAADRKAAAAVAAHGTTKGETKGIKGGPQTKSGSTTGRPPADTTDEGPPTDEPAPGQQQAQGAARTLSGMVDQHLVHSANGKMTLQSGTITLTFVPEPDTDPPGGRVDVTSSTTLTYVFHYRNPPPHDFSDREVSTCTLTGARFLRTPSGDVNGGIVGGYTCNVESGRTGQPVRQSTMSGALRLDQRHPLSGAAGWYLTFVNGPQGAIWELH